MTVGVYASQDVFGAGLGGGIFQKRHDAPISGFPAVKPDSIICASLFQLSASKRYLERLLFGFNPAAISIGASALD